MMRHSVQTKRKKVKYSLAKQVTLIFVCVFTLSIAACWLVNNFYLEKFYISNKEKSILNIYRKVNAQSYFGTLSSYECDEMLMNFSTKYDVSIMIISSLFEPIRIYASEPEEDLIREMQNNLMGLSTPSELLENNDDYVLMQINSGRTEFIEMWGLLADGSLFMMRTPIESIRTSVDIANRFLMYVGIGTIVFGGILIAVVTKHLSKPIVEIADIADRCAHMDFEARYTGTQKSEIGLLGNSINAMNISLERTVSQLKSANVELMRDIERRNEMDNMRNEFVSNVSHELKTPIALIQGYAEGLMEGVNEEDERDYYCEVIADEAGKMNTIVKKLLTLNQLEFGNNEIKMERFNICELISNYIANLEILTEKNGIRVVWNPQNPVYVWADEFMTEEILMNYFSNAINHCESESDKRIEVSVEQSDGCAKILVFNTGREIPLECIGHIWEKFYKVDKARTREYGGSGVGLSIVKAIVDSFGQKCGVENSDGGVTFWFTLDICQIYEVEWNGK